MENYYKISDIIFKFDNNTVLKFNTVLSYVDNLGNTKFSHNEYQFTLNRKQKNEVVRSIIRHPNYYLSIESRRENSNIKEFLKINSGDFYQFKIAINKYLQNNNSTDMSMQLENGQFITLSKSNNNLIINCNAHYNINLESFKLIEFVSIINELNLMQMWNNHMIYISSNNYLGKFQNYTTVDDTDKGKIDTKSNFITSGKKPVKKSFFDL